VSAVRDLQARWPLVVDTGGGRQVDVRLDASSGRVRTIDMGPVTFARADRSRSAGAGLTAGSSTHYEGDAAGMGNPHLVLFVEDPGVARVTQHGPHLEHDPRFPQRTNVEFVRVTPGATDELDMRVWERGVGETLSCGTGASASAAVAHRRGLVGERVTVHVPGGDLTVELGDTPGQGIRLGGPVVHVFDTTVDLDALLVDDRADEWTEVARRSAGRWLQEVASGRRLTRPVDLGVVRQRALLVGTGFGLRDAEAAEASLEELAALTDTAGADPVQLVLQRRDTPDPATYIGSGKALELKELTDALDIDLVVFDDELTPAQQRNLEKLFAVDVVDRTALILDIFAQHARSQEGMVQVELAAALPPPAAARTRSPAEPAGCGHRTRGPGETQLEVDRRRITTRMARLEKELDRLAKNRATQRKARRRRSLTTVALVGYTNAGKSTLLNRLTEAHVLVEDKLFSTLDPATRRLRLPGGEMVLLSDTVGFVSRLPHQLVESFRSTLEEVWRGAAPARGRRCVARRRCRSPRARCCRIADRVPGCSWSTRPTCARRRPRRAGPRTPARCRVGRHRNRHRSCSTGWGEARARPVLGPGASTAAT
jgi:GTP-binding protein HflX/diaminopimelate epimerase